MEYRYDLVVLLMEYPGNADTLFAALVRWLAVEQPDVLDRGPERDRGARFEVDVLEDDNASEEMAREHRHQQARRAN